MKRRVLPYFLGLVIVFAVTFWLLGNKPSALKPDASPSPIVFSSPTTVAAVSPTLEYKTIKAADIANVPNEYTYSAQIPENWLVEVIKEAEAINIYDPEAVGQSNLDKSQIFIRYFRANDFLTLQTVDILERKTLSVKNRPAIRYVIQKKPDVPDFPNQPNWRNQKHTVTDVRVSDSGQSIFYVIAKKPELSEEQYQHFLQSISW